MRNVFSAIADPTRRQLLDRLSREEASAGELGVGFAISQPAMSRHLRVLREAGLVRVSRRGRQRIYGIDPQGLRVVYDWVRHYARFWDERLATLGDYLDRTEP